MNSPEGGSANLGGTQKYEPHWRRDEQQIANIDKRSKLFPRRHASRHGKNTKSARDKCKHLCSAKLLNMIACRLEHWLQVDGMVQRSFVHILTRPSTSAADTSTRVQWPVTDLQKHISDHLQALYDSTHDNREPMDDDPVGQPDQSKESNIWQVTRVAIDRAMTRISAHIAQGPDGIPAGLIKCLGESAREHLAVIFSGIPAGDAVPADWLCSRVTLLCKRGGDGGLLRDYRPLTVTCVLYRLLRC